MSSKRPCGTTEGELQFVISSWFDRGEPIPDGWKSDASPTCDVTFGDLQKIGTIGCADLMSRARTHASRLKALSDVLVGLSTAIQEESKAAQAKFKLISNMCGLLRLPNELLRRIFDYIVNADQNLTHPARWKAAVTLSHVNQYFRNAVISCASLWSNISRKTDRVNLSLSRSGLTPLDVQLLVGFLTAVNSHYYRLLFEKFTPVILPLSKRWRTLDIRYVPYPRAHYPDERESFCGLDVASLESLHVRNETQNKYFRYLTEFEHWIAPKLRHITAFHSFPLVLTALGNLTSLDVKFKFGEINLEIFLQNLALMTSLEDLVMRIARPTRINRTPVTLAEKVDFANVRHVRIEITHPPRPGPQPLMKAFFSSLFFPMVVDLHIVLIGHIDSAKPKNPSEKHDVKLVFEKELGYVLQLVEQYPHVTHFSLEGIMEGISLDDGGNPSSSTNPLVACVTTVVPLSMLPSLKHLSILSKNSATIPLVTPKDLKANPPKLETITITTPSDKRIVGIARFIQSVLRAQKNGGGWADFRELIVIDFDDVDNSQILKEKSTGRHESALEWCEKQIPKDSSDGRSTRSRPAVVSVEEVESLDNNSD